MPTAKSPSSAPKRIPKKVTPADRGKSPSKLIDARIAELPGWRGTLLAQLRALIVAADSEISEEWKWNVPVWSCKGIICTGEAYKKAVKLTFAKGASLADPSRLFNSSLEAGMRRAIDFPEGAQVSASAFQALIQAAVVLNKSSTTQHGSSAA
jgi:hypothetical protein